MHFAIFFNLNFINPRIYYTSGKNLSSIAHHKGTRQNKNSFASKTMKWMAQVWKSETLDMVTYSDLLCPHQGFLEKELATHSRIRVWRIPGTEEPGRLHSMGSQRVRHNWATITHSSSLWPHPSLSSLENSMDRGAWQAPVHGVTKNQTQLSNCYSLIKSLITPVSSLFLNCIPSGKKGVFLTMDTHHSSLYILNFNYVPGPV